MSALPGVAQSSKTEPQSLSQTAADPIPANVLSYPIIGEARRFDGAVAPAGWMLMAGETLSTVRYSPLFHIIGTRGGGDGKTIFKLPQPKQGWIIAVAGTFPMNAAVFAQLGRHMDHQDSLGPNVAIAHRAPPAKLRGIQDQRAAALRDQQQLARSAIRPGSSRTAPISPEALARIDRAREDARTTALAAVSPENRARVEGLVAGVLAGTVGLYDATRQMTASLGIDESRVVLDVYDATQRTLGGPPSIGHPDPQLEAGRYLVAIAFTADQLVTLRTMHRDE